MTITVPIYTRGSILPSSSWNLVANILNSAGTADGIVLTDAQNSISVQLVAADAGEAPRSLASLFSDIPNLFNYGVDYTGVNSASVPIGNAIQDLTTNGGAALLAPYGTYNWQGGVSITGNNYPGLVSFGSIWNHGFPYFFGNTDGSVWNYPGVSQNGHVLGLCRQLNDDATQSVLVVQAIDNNESATVSYEKPVFYINATQNAVSNAASNLTKDLVGINATLNVGAGNTQGRTCAANFVANCPAGAQGTTCGMEIDMQNNSGTDNDYLFGNTLDLYQKNGCYVVNTGANNTRFAFGYTTSNFGKFDIGYFAQAYATNRYVFMLVDISNNPLSWIDNSGNYAVTSLGLTNGSEGESSGATVQTSITTGTAVPSSTQPAGSLYLRAGGSAGARLYVSAGSGAWNAVAGV